MTVFSYEHAAARDELILAAMRVIAADHYAREEDPHADAESEYAGEKLALAARDLVRAVDALPESDQPIGWGKQSEPVSHVEAMSTEPVPIEGQQADDDAGLVAHRVRIYSHKPAHAPEYWVNHPADCDALPYGEECWFDDLVAAERDLLAPWQGWPDAGFYLATAPAEGEIDIRFEPTEVEG